MRLSKDNKGLNVAVSRSHLKGYFQPNNQINIMFEHYFKLLFEFVEPLPSISNSLYLLLR